MNPKTKGLLVVLSLGGVAVGTAVVLFLWTQAAQVEVRGIQPGLVLSSRESGQDVVRLEARGDQVWVGMEGQALAVQTGDPDVAGWRHVVVSLPESEDPTGWLAVGGRQGEVSIMVPVMRASRVMRDGDGRDMVALRITQDALTGGSRPERGLTAPINNALKAVTAPLIDKQLCGLRVSDATTALEWTSDGLGATFMLRGTEGLRLEAGVGLALSVRAGQLDLRHDPSFGRWQLTPPTFNRDSLGCAALSMVLQFAGDLGEWAKRKLSSPLASALLRYVDLSALLPQGPFKLEQPRFEAGQWAQFKASVDLAQLTSSTVPAVRHAERLSDEQAMGSDLALDVHLNVVNALLARFIGDEQLGGLDGKEFSHPDVRVVARDCRMEAAPHLLPAPRPEEELRLVVPAVVCTLRDKRGERPDRKIWIALQAPVRWSDQDGAPVLEVLLRDPGAHLHAACEAPEQGVWGVCGDGFEALDSLIGDYLTHQGLTRLPIPTPRFAREHVESIEVTRPPWSRQWLRIQVQGVDWPAVMQGALP